MENTKNQQSSLNLNQYQVTIGEKTSIVTVLPESTVRVDGKTHTYNLAVTSPGLLSLKLDDKVFEISALASLANNSGESTVLYVNGRPYELIVDDRRSLVKKNLMQVGATSAKGQVIRAPMPGKVVKIEVEVGAHVLAGAGLIVLEAMKMENEIKASAPGTVDSIYVEAGKAVEKGELLLSISPNSLAP